VKTKKTEGAFSGSKLRTARFFFGLTLAELGERLAVSRQYVYLLESGAKTPSDEVLVAAADTLGVTPEFFFAPIGDEFREEECNFRRRRSTSLAIRQQAVAHGTLFGAVVSYLDDALSLPADSLPRVSHEDQDIERLTETCRIHWGLGIDRPIQNMTRLLENAGTVVSHFQGASEKVDAFSRAGRRNVAVLSSLQGSACRRRFDLAHELGHLVLHVGLEPPQTREDENRREAAADQFAGAFLFPRTGMKREFPRAAGEGRVRWADLLELKNRWGMSLAAILYRAHELGLIDGGAYRRANMAIRAKRWHKREPLDDYLKSEPPEVIPLAFAQLQRSYGISAEGVAAHLHMRNSTFERVVGVALPEPEDRQEGAEIHRLDHYRHARLTKPS
jgi:Zn-dependent peptidase ImmA (M78 family)/transcriptional regulator with XRE-family HTH domain